MDPLRAFGPLCLEHPKASKLSTLRTFIAIELSQDVRQRAADLITRLARTGVKVKWVESDKMHLTLKFLGDVSQEQIPTVCSTVADAVRGTGTFSIDCRGAGAFPRVSRPRTVWLGFGAGTEQLVRLQEVIDKALAKVGFPREGRKYKPHLTLGRVRDGGAGVSSLGDLVQHNSDFVAGESTVEQVVVFASELTREGPIYTVLGRARLASA
jgi:2'-5' RNA ligase